MRRAASRRSSSRCRTSSRRQAHEVAADARAGARRPLLARVACTSSSTTRASSSITSRPWTSARWGSRSCSRRCVSSCARARGGTSSPPRIPDTPRPLAQRARRVPRRRRPQRDHAGAQRRRAEALPRQAARRGQHLPHARGDAGRRDAVRRVRRNRASAVGGRSSACCRTSTACRTCRTSTCAGRSSTRSRSRSARSCSASGSACCSWSRRGSVRAFWQRVRQGFAILARLRRLRPSRRLVAGAELGLPPRDDLLHAARVPRAGDDPQRAARPDRAEPLDAAADHARRRRHRAGSAALPVQRQGEHGARCSRSASGCTSRSSSLNVVLGVLAVDADHATR